jgi:predicted hotdog family 3-hydroxylacyl-ACP dehydratase
MDVTGLDMESLIPHRGVMRLVDRVLADDGETTRVEATVRGDGPFVRDGVLASWVGIELMAQSIAAWAGLRRLEAKQDVKLGFLLGSRRYDCDVQGFAVGTRLEVTVKQEIVSAQGLAVFACTVHDGQRLVAQANVNVFQPDDVEGYLKELLHA